MIGFNGWQGGTENLILISGCWYWCSFESKWVYEI